MSSLRYVSHAGVEVPLDGDGLWTDSAAGLRGRVWEAELSAHALSSASRRAREATCGLHATDRADLDRAEAAFDSDLAAMEPGSVVAPGGWSQRAYVTRTEVSLVSPSLVSATVTVVLLDGAWRRVVAHELRPSGGDAMVEGGLGYPHGYGHDYATAHRGTSISFSEGSLARVTFWGPCRDPYVRVGGNLYGVTGGVEVPAGARLVIDPTRLGELGHAVELVGRYGESQNLFHRRVRGAEGSGTYAFERLPGGEAAVTWPQEYGVTIEEVQERSSPPWC